MKKLYKLITLPLVIIFLCQDIGWSAPIAQPKNINLQLSTIFIPEQYGSVEKSNPVNGQTVILLKDAHCNYETQTNIIKILDTLIRDYKIDLIGVEGASGYVNPSIVLESNPKDDLREKVSDRYLRTGLLTASEALSINMGKEPGFSIFGTEDLRLYLKDFKAFRDTIGLNPYARRFNELVSNVISQLKGKIYPPGLTGFDVVVKKYESNSLPLSRLIKILIYNYGIQNGYENLKLVYKSIRLDERIDFKKAERERTGIIKELEKSMPKEDLQELVKKSLLYKLGKIPTIEYYTYLEPLARTANLKDYIRLIKLQDRIDETGLFRELDGFIERIYARLCPNKTAVDLHQLDKNIGILNKLLHLEATRDDLAYYRENAALFMPEKLLQFIKIQAPLNNIKLPPELNESSFIENTRKAIIPAGEFYKFALERDNALVENLLSIMQKNKKEKAVLICGGFHTEGIKGILQNRDISILTITPSITRVQEDAHELYLARMLDKRIDPEKMLSELGIENIQPILATSPEGQKIELPRDIIEALRGRRAAVEEAVTPDEFRRLHPLLLELHSQGGSLAAMVQQAVDSYNALSGVEKISLPQGLSAWRTKLDKLTEEEAGEYDNYMREKAKAGRTKKWMGIDSGDLSGEDIVKEDTGLIEEQDKKGVLDLIERKLGSQSTTFKALRNSRVVDPQGNTIDIEFKWGILTKGVEAHSIRDRNRVIIYLDKNFIETVPEEDKPLVIAQLIHHEITEQIEGKSHTKAVLAEFELEDDKSKPVSRASEIILEKAIQQAIEGDGNAQAYLKKLTENTNNAVREIINNTSLSSAEQTRLINMAFAIHGMITGNKELAKKGIIPIESIMPYQILEERILKDDLMYFMGAAGRGHYGLLNYLMGFISFTVFAFINLFGIIPLIKFLIRIMSGSTMGVRFGGQYAPRRITRAETIRYKEERRLLIEALEKTNKTIESFFKEIFPLYLHLLNNEESDELIDQRVINFSSNISEELRNYITEIQSSLKSRQKISKEAFKERLFYATNTFNNRYLIDNGYYMQGLSLEGPRLLFNFSRITRLREANRIRVLFIEGIILQNEKEFETTGGYSVPSRDMPDVVVLTNNVKKVSGEEIPTEKPGIWHRLLAERLRQLNIRMDKREGFLYDYLCRSYATHEMQHKNIERQEPDRRSFVYSRNHLEQIAGITLDDNEMSSFLAQFLSEDTKIELAYLMRYLSKAEDIIHAIDIHQRKIREYEQEKNILKKLSLWVQRLIFGDRYVFTPEPSIDPHLAALLLIIDRFYSFARTEGKINQEELDRMEKITDLNQRLAETGKQLFYRTKAGDLRRYAVMLFEERLSKYSIGFNDVDKQLLEIHKLLREHYYTDALRLLDRLPLELDGLAIRDLPSGQIIRLVREQIGLIPAEEINIKRKIQANLRKFVQASKERDTEIRTKLEEPAVMAHFEELAVGEDLVYDDGTKARGTLSAEDVRRITDSIQRKGRPVETGLGITLKLKDSELNNILLENLAKLLEKLQESEREEFLAKLKANAPPDGLVIAILDQSEHLGENCKGDGFIGVNRYLLLKLQEAVDQDTRDALSNLLQVILYHELRHEARMFEGPDEEFRQNLVDIRYLEGRWMDILIRLGLINPESKFKKITDTVNEIADRLGKYGIEMDDNQKEELKKNLLEAYAGESQINLLQLINMLAKGMAPEDIFQLTTDIAEPLNRFLGNKEPEKGAMMIAAVLNEILQLIPSTVESEEDKLLKTIQKLAAEKGIDPNTIQSIFDLFRSGLEILAVDPSYKLDSNYFVLISQIEKLTGIDDKKIIEVFERRGLSRERAEAVPDSPLAQEVQKLALYIELHNISIRGDLDMEFDSRRSLFYLDGFTGKIDRTDNGDIRFLSAVDAVNKDLAKAYNEMRRGPGGPIIDRTEPVTLVISSEEIIDIQGNKFSYKPGIQALLKTLVNGKNIHIIIRADRQARHLLEKTGILNEQITVEDSEKNLKDIRTDAELSGWARDGDHVVFLLTPEEGESIETKGLKVFGTAAGTAFHTALLFGVAYAQAQTIDEIVTAINTLKLLGMAPAEVDEIIRNIKEKGLGFFTVRLIRIEETLKELRTRRLYIEVAA